MGTLRDVGGDSMLNYNLKKLGRRILDGVILAYGVYIAVLFSELSYQNRKDWGEAVASFIVNSPMITEYGWQFLTRLGGIRENPFYLVGLALGIFPAIAGVDIGYDGAKGIVKEKFFDALSAAFMFCYMLSTRGGGAMAISNEIKEALISPIIARRNKSKFCHLVLRQQVSNFPGYFLPIHGQDEHKDQLSSASVVHVMKTCRKDKTWSQNLFIFFEYLRKIIVSPIFFIGAALTVPLWLSIATKSWNYLHSGLGDQKSLVNITMVSNLIFYSRAGYRFPGVVFREYLMRILNAMYNPTGRLFANIVRVILGCLLFGTILWLCWKSGAGMKALANNIDLTTVMNGYFSFLNNYYGYIAQLYAGVFINGSAFADFFLNSMSKYHWYNQLINRVLTLLGAQDKKSNIAGSILIPENQLVWINKKRILEKIGSYTSIAADMSIEPLFIETPLTYLGVFKLQCKEKISSPEDYQSTGRMTASSMKPKRCC